MALTKNQKIITVTLTLILTLIIGYLIGSSSRRPILERIIITKNDYYETLIQDTKLSDINNESRDYLINQVDSNKIRDHLKYLTGFAHMAGTPGIYSTQILFKILILFIITTKKVVKSRLTT